MIRARGLSRTFTVKQEVVHAVRGIDLDVDEGEFIAFLGPNGAGKSTSLRMLTTLLTPTSGTARVVGHDIAEEPVQVRRKIGYIGQGNGSGNEIRIGDELVSHARYYGLSRRQARQRAAELISAMGLEGLENRVAERLSGGQRRRVDIALGLMHSPRLLFLDEPSSGLDPHNRARVWEYVRGLHQQGMTMFLTTHYLDEADQLANRVIIVDKGRVVADGSPDRLKADQAGDLMTLVLAEEDEAALTAVHAERMTASDRITVDGKRVEIRVAHGDELLPGFLLALDAAGAKVTSATLTRPTLDDVFLALTGRSLEEADEPAAPAA
ncbi:ATP-binding cassette domain-containing protein [Streptomyces sp. NPDC020875]|uniref:ATP-binding cassette domain-containing protein n=1 Tax=Streptomyces sp. NPDC020875 TaxID=3154898 RepID=UPI0033F72B32